MTKKLVRISRITLEWVELNNNKMSQQSQIRTFRLMSHWAWMESKWCLKITTIMQMHRMTKVKARAGATGRAKRVKSDSRPRIS